MLGRGTGVRLLASLNGVPFFRCEAGRVPGSRSGLCNHLLRPGHNLFSIEIECADPSSNVVFSITSEADLDGSVFGFAWPNVWQSLPLAERRFPFVHTETFEVQGISRSPVYLDAPPADFDADETARLHEAVARFHEALRLRDVDAVVREGSLKIAEFHRFYPDDPGATEEGTRRAFEDLFSSPTVTRGLEPERLVIRRCVDGRAAYITGSAGRPALNVMSREGTELSRDVWLTRSGGRWRLFR